MATLPEITKSFENKTLSGSSSTFVELLRRTIRENRNEHNFKKQTLKRTNSMDNLQNNNNNNIMQ